jgi:phosphate starvation-inducible PhoH-like protein
MAQKNRYTGGMADGSPHFNFEVKNLRWTEKQETFIAKAMEKETKIVICEAPPGVGKTLLALYCSLQLLSERRVGQILYVRNPIEASENQLGFLKGDIEAKMAPFSAPLIDNLCKLISDGDNRKLARENQIDAIALGHIKGRTFDNTALIFDEAEDFSDKQILLSLSRIGKGSKVFLIGDSRQQNSRESGFKRSISVFDDDESRENGIVVQKFDETDIMRSGIAKFVYRKLAM